MRSAWLGALFLVLGCGASQAEVDALNKRVTALERQVKATSGPLRAKVKGKRRPAVTAPSNRPTGTVELLGDARVVYLAGDGGRVPAPGPVPAGSYLVLATFEDGAAPVKAGSVEVPAGETVRLTCSVAEKSCSAE